MPKFYLNNWLNEQRKATQALLQFCLERERERGLYVDSIRDCLAALERKDIDAAMHSFRCVTLGGNGCFNDWFPPPIHPGETPEYVQTVFEALINHWNNLMRLSNPPESCRACGKVMIPGPLFLGCHLARSS